MPVDGERVINPAMHHINIKTTKLQEMIDWYGLVLGAKVNFQNPIVAFISNDRANHRIALLAVPELHDDPQKFVHTGLYCFRVRFFCRSHVDLCAAEKGGHRTSVQY